MCCNDVKHVESSAYRRRCARGPVTTAGSSDRLGHKPATASGALALDRASDSYRGLVHAPGASFVAREVGPATIGVLVVAQAVLWVAGAAGGQPRAATSGSLLGAESILLLSIGLVLISTLPWVEEWFDGIDRAAIWHRRVAITGLVLLAPHILLSSNPHGTALGGPLGVDRGDRPGRARAVGDPAALAVRGARAPAGLVVAARDAPVVRDVRRIFGGYDRWRALHRTTGLFVAAGFVHGVLDGTPFDDAPVLRWSYVAVGGIGVAFYVYRELLARFFLSLHDYEVDAVREIDEGLVEVAMRPIGRPVEFVPGPVRDGLPRSQGRLAPPSVHDLQRSARGCRPSHGQGAGRLHVAPPASSSSRACRRSSAALTGASTIGREPIGRCGSPAASASRRSSAGCARSTGTCRIAWTSSTRPTARRRSPRRSAHRRTPRVAARASDRHEHRGPPHVRARPRCRRRRPPRAVGLHVRPAGDAAHLPDAAAARGRAGQAHPPRVLRLALTPAVPSLASRSGGG